MAPFYQRVKPNKGLPLLTVPITSVDRERDGRHHVSNCTRYVLHRKQRSRGEPHKADSQVTLNFVAEETSHTHCTVCFLQGLFVKDKLNQRKTHVTLISVSRSVQLGRDVRMKICSTQKDQRWALTRMFSADVSFRQHFCVSIHNADTEFQHQCPSSGWVQNPFELTLASPSSAVCVIQINKKNYSKQKIRKAKHDGERGKPGMGTCTGGSRSIWWIILLRGQLSSKNHDANLLSSHRSLKLHA